MINYALGRGDQIIKAAHEYGGKVVGTVVMERHASRSERDGADGLVVTGHEAAAHGGDVTSMVLIPAMARNHKIPIIAAGGFCDGRGLAAALALGAEGISMGTRFTLTKESRLEDNFKQLCLKATVEDTIYTDKVDGMPSRFLKTRTAELMATERVSIIRAIRSALEIKRMLNAPWWKLIYSGLRMRSVQDLLRLPVGVSSLRRAVEGDVTQGILPVGQDVGLINDLPAVQELIEGIIAEAEQVLEAIRGRIVSSART